MNARRVQRFLLVLLVFACFALGHGSDRKVYALKFSDVDGHQLSTTDGRVNVLVFVTSAELNKAELVGDRIPDFCLGNSAYRMITVVEAGNHSAPIRLGYESVARRRLNAAAKRLQTRYDSHQIQRVARQDVFATIDFGGTLALNFTNQADVSTFRIVVLGPKGELRDQWTQLPTEQELAEALK